MNDEAMFKTPVPAAVKFETSGVLEPLTWNWFHIAHVCIDAMEAYALYVILPVDEPHTYKPHKRRIIKEDKSSPSGLIMRDEDTLKRYYPYAAARFDAKVLWEYANTQVDKVKQDPVQFQRMFLETVEYWRQTGHPLYDEFLEQTGQADSE